MCNYRPRSFAAAEAGCPLDHAPCGAHFTDAAEHESSCRECQLIARDEAQEASEREGLISTLPATPGKRAPDPCMACLGRGTVLGDVPASRHWNAHRALLECGACHGLGVAPLANDVSPSDPPINPDPTSNRK